LKLVSADQAQPVQLVPPVANNVNKRGRWDRQVSRSPTKKNPFEKFESKVNDDTDSDKIDYNKI